MSRISQAKLLVSRANDLISKIEAQYSAALRSKKIPDELLLDVKHCTESLRSPLDYLAAELDDRTNTATPRSGRRRTPYFPIRRSKAEFDKAMGRDFADLLATRPDIVAALESVQSFTRADNDWLPKLAELVNENKHDQLTPQTRTERSSLHIQHGGAGIAIGQGAGIHIGAGASISIGGAVIPGGQSLTPGKPVRADPRLKVENITWVDFRFTRTGDPVLPFLRRARDGVNTAIANVEKLL